MNPFMQDGGAADGSLQMFLVALIALALGNPQNGGDANGWGGFPQQPGNNGFGHGEDHVPHGPEGLDQRYPDFKFPPKQGGSGPNAFRTRFLQLINAFRHQHGKGRGKDPVQLNDRLNQAADNHAYDMASNHMMKHDGSNGSDFVDRMRQVGYRMRGYAVENIALGRSADDVFRTWLNSAEHRKNMLAAGSQLGVSLIDGYSSMTLSD